MVIKELLDWPGEKTFCADESPRVWVNYGFSRKAIIPALYQCR